MTQEADSEAMRVARGLTDIECPFCGETGFDGWGLHLHFTRFGGCEVYNAVCPEIYDGLSVAEAARKMEQGDE